MYIWSESDETYKKYQFIFDVYPFNYDFGIFSGVAVICRVQEKNAGREKMSVQETLSAERQEIVLSGNEVPVNGADEDTLSADTDYVLEEHDKKEKPRWKV